MSDTNTSATGGVGISGLLGVAFIILKLTGVIGWAWLWVLAPFWIPLALAVVIIGLAALVHLIATK